MKPTVPQPGPRALGRGALLDQLASEAEPVVVICGPPGVGKSTLAAAAARAAGGTACWVEARGCTSLAELWERLARARGIRAEAAPEELTGASGELLVILDHCDGLGDPLRELPQRPGLRWLLTRRGPLPGAAALPVPPLGLDGAGRLWTALSRGAPPAEDQLARLLQLCDGLPLALELAARRQRMLGTRALLARLEHSTAVLGEGLAAAVRESLAGLPPAARAALARLGAGPPLVPVEALPTVLQDLGEPFDLLEPLHDAGLLDPTAPEGSMRVLRSAVDQLPAPDAPALERWSRWCAQAAQRLAAGEAADFPRVVSDALAWRAERAQELTATERLDLAMALRRRMGGPLLRRLVDTVSLDAVAPERQRSLLRCKLRALELSGQQAAAAEVLEQAGALAESPELTGTLAFAIDRAGDPGGALRYLRQALARLEPVARQDADQYTVFAHLATYAAWLQWWWQGDTGGAVALLEGVLALRPARADEPLKVLQGLAAMRIHSGQRAPGRAALKAVQERLHAQGVRPLYISGLLVEGELLWHGARDPEAAELGAQGLALAQEIDSAAGELAARLLLAQICAHQRRTAAALAHLEAGLQRVLGTSLDFTHCQLWFELAALQADRGQAESSTTALEKAVALCEQGVDRYGVRALEQVVRGHQALAAAERAEEPGPHLDVLEQVLAMPRPPRVAAVLWQRWQHRLREQAELRAPPRDKPQQLRIGADYGWFQADGSPPCDLRRSRNNRRMLAALVEAEGPVDSAALVARVWPDQQLLERSARHRVHVALSALRKGGLAPFLEREDHGYVLVVPGGILHEAATAPPES